MLQSPQWFSAVGNLAAYSSELLIAAANGFPGLELETMDKIRRATTVCRLFQEITSYAVHLLHCSTAQLAGRLRSSLLAPAAK